MKATALVCDANQRFSLENVDLAEPGPDQLLIRTLYSGVSVGTEFALIRNKISWGPYPLCTGYMGVGEVERAGPETRGFKPGDRVYYRGNAGEMRLASGEALSRVSGTHASHLVAGPEGDHGVDRLPEGAPLAEASMFVLPAVGLAGVDMAGPRMGEQVLVYGAGLIGLGVIAACAARGCVVTAVDLDPEARRRALAFGADYVLDPARDDPAAHFARLSPDTKGADVTFEATGLPACLAPAMELTRTGGSFVWQGNYGAAPVSLPFLLPHGKRLTMRFPCDDGYRPCRRAVLKQMASGALPWSRAVTHRIRADEAPGVYAAINAGDRSYAGVVIQWS